MVDLPTFAPDRMPLCAGAVKAAYAAIASLRKSYAQLARSLHTWLPLVLIYRDWGPRRANAVVDLPWARALRDRFTDDQHSRLLEGGDFSDFDYAFAHHVSQEIVQRDGIDQLLAEGE
jgi:hypothetical protein